MFLVTFLPESIHRHYIACTKMEEGHRSDLLRPSKKDLCSASIIDFTPSLSTQTFWVFLTDCTQALAGPPPSIQPVCALASRLQLLCI